MVALGGKDVLGGVLRADGAEGAGSDLEREEGVLDSRLRQPLEEAGGEVQTGGGGGGAARLAGVHGLVALGVARELADVGREGDGAGGGGVDGAVEGHRRDLLRAATDGRGEGTVARLQPVLAAGGGGTPGTHKRGPGAVFVFAQEEELDASAGVGARTEEAGGHDTRVVQNEEVARTQKGWEITDVVVAERARTSGCDQQAGGVAGFDRLLCDELGRQVVVEVRGAHAGSIALSRAAV